MSNTVVTPVAGVPNFFVWKWLIVQPKPLGVVLALLGVLDLLLFLINFALGDMLAVLVNLGLGIVEVASALVLLGVWKPDNVMLDRLSVGCMIGMWVMAVWTLTGRLPLSGSVFAFLFIGFVLLGGMGLMGSAASVFKARSADYYRRL